MTTATPQERRSTHAMFGEAEASQQRGIAEDLWLWCSSWPELAAISTYALERMRDDVTNELEARNGNK